MAETIKIAVCDDEKNIRSYLVSLSEFFDCKQHLHENNERDDKLKRKKQFLLLEEMCVMWQRGILAV